MADKEEGGLMAEQDKLLLETDQVRREAIAKAIGARILASDLHDSTRGIAIFAWLTETNLLLDMLFAAMKNEMAVRELPFILSDDSIMVRVEKHLKDFGLR